MTGSNRMTAMEEHTISHMTDVLTGITTDWCSIFFFFFVISLFSLIKQVQFRQGKDVLNFRQPG